MGRRNNISEFRGFSNKDFDESDSSKWGKKLGLDITRKLVEINDSFQYRVPRGYNMVFWGTQSLFKESDMKYRNSKLFVWLDNKSNFMKTGLWVERGFENEDNRKIKNKAAEFMDKYDEWWDWYRFEENLRSSVFIEKLNNKINNGYESILYIDSDWNNGDLILEANQLIPIVTNWADNNKYADYWGDLLVYKKYKKDEVMDMYFEDILEVIMNIFKEIEDIYNIIKKN